MKHHPLFAVCFGILCGILSPHTMQAGGFSVVGNLTREATLDPGGKTEGRIDVTNASDEAIEVEIDQRDYRFAADGSNHYDEAGTNPRSNAAWITVSPRRLAIPAHTSLPVYYSIQVPADASLIGTGWSVVMIHPVLEDFEIARQKGKAVVGVRTVVQYAVQMVTHLGSSGSVAMRFADRRLVENDGRRALQLDLENTGQRSITPNVWLQLYDASGTDLGRMPAERKRIYPGCSTRLPIDLSKLARGRYTGLVVADLGDDNVFGSQYTLDIP